MKDFTSKKVLIGHRGGSAKLHLENTLDAFAHAIAIGLEWIEIDVQKVDDELFVFHDYTLERLSTLSSPLSLLTSSEVRNIALINNAKIPSLDEVLDLCFGKIKINIEIKTSNTAEQVVEILKKHISSANDYEDFLISSFDHYEIKRLLDSYPFVPRATLVYGIPLNVLATVKDLKTKILILDIDYVSREIVENAHKENILVYCYTVNTTNYINKFLQIGADGVFTDYPELISPYIA
jgi:glycerophosphoryl diester phosphodiesterase